MTGDETYTAEVIRLARPSGHGFVISYRFSSRIGAGSSRLMQHGGQPVLFFSHGVAFPWKSWRDSARYARVRVSCPIGARMSAQCDNSPARQAVSSKVTLVA